MQKFLSILSPFNGCGNLRSWHLRSYLYPAENATLAAATGGVLPFSFPKYCHYGRVACTDHSAYKTLFCAWALTMRLTELAYFKIAAIFSWLVPGFLEFLDPRRIELAQGAGRPHGSSTRSACASMGLGDSRERVTASLCG